MKVSEQIIEVIDALCEKFGIAIDWTAENVMPYIEKLCVKFINYEIYTSVAWMCFWCGLTLLCWTITAFLVRGARKLEYPWDDDYVVTYIAIGGLVVSGFISFITVCVIGCQIFDIIEATAFPEKTIYDYISGLIRSSSN